MLYAPSHAPLCGPAHARTKACLRCATASPHLSFVRSMGSASSRSRARRLPAFLRAGGRMGDRLLALALRLPLLRGC